MARRVHGEGPGGHKRVLHFTGGLKATKSQDPRSRTRHHRSHLPRTRQDLVPQETLARRMGHRTRHLPPLQTRRPNRRAGLRSTPNQQATPTHPLDNRSRPRPPQTTVPVRLAIAVRTVGFGGVAWRLGRFASMGVLMSSRSRMFGLILVGLAVSLLMVVGVALAVLPPGGHSLMTTAISMSR